MTVLFLAGFIFALSRYITIPIIGCNNGSYHYHLAIWAGFVWLSSYIIYWYRLWVKGIILIGLGYGGRIIGMSDNRSKYLFRSVKDQTSRF